MRSNFRLSLEREIFEREADATTILREVVTLAEKFNLSSVVLNSWRDLLGRFWPRVRTRPFLTAVSLFAVGCLVVFSVSLVVRQPIQSTLPHILFFLAIGDFSIWIVWRAYHYLVPEVVHYAIGMPSGDEGRTRMLKWFGSVFDLRKQITRGVLVVVAGELVWLHMDRTIAGFPTSLASYLALGFACMFVSQGAYWLLAAPTYLTQLSRLRLELGTFDPAESRPLKQLTQLVIWFVLACGLTFALGLTLYLFVWPYSRSPLMLLLVYFVVLGLIVYAFVRSNIDLARIITREKNRMMCDIQQQIVRIYDSPGPTGTDELEQIKGLWELYEKVKATRDSALSVGMFRSLSSSVLLQVVPITAKVSVDVLGGKTALDAVRSVVQ